MKTYTQFILKIYISALINIFLIFFSLIFILNLLTELEFFKELEVSSFFPLYLSLINTPMFVFEMLPFIFLISTQVFFNNLFNNNEMNIFKYSGLKNSKIFSIISTATFVLGIFIILIFYNFSSNLKYFYFGLKSNYTTDDQYLAVITKNGLWMKDINDDKTLMINATGFSQNELQETYISEFDKNYEIIQNLFSNMSSLSVFELIELRNNYKRLSYSLTEVDLQLIKLITFPIFLILMVIFSGIIMMNTKNLQSKNLKITIGLFFSVVIYYINNFFYVLGNTEKINILTAVTVPLLFFALINLILLRNVNVK